MDSLKKWLKRFWIFVLGGLALTILVSIGIMYWTSQEPETIKTADILEMMSEDPVIGEASVVTMIAHMDTLLNKPSGFTRNDVTPPWLFLDNMPEWEFGATNLVRDFALAMRNEISRSQSQSKENKFLTDAQTLLANDVDQWILPTPESKLTKAKKNYEDYLRELRTGNAQFYARADNLNDWFDLVTKRLGHYSNFLAASHQISRVNTDLSGDSSAEQSSEQPEEVVVETPFMLKDNSFFEARGYCWALISNLKAMKIDFESVLKNKDAIKSIDQIIDELEYTQEEIWVPFIWGGSGLGITTNPSLVISSYIARAHSAMKDIKDLLEDG